MRTSKEERADLRARCRAGVIAITTDAALVAALVDDVEELDALVDAGARAVSQMAQDAAAEVDRLTAALRESGEVREAAIALRDAERKRRIDTELELAEVRADLAAEGDAARRLCEGLDEQIEGLKRELAEARAEAEAHNVAATQYEKDIAALRATVETLSADAREVRDAAMRYASDFTRPGETAAPAIERMAVALDVIRAAMPTGAALLVARAFDQKVRELDGSGQPIDLLDVEIKVRARSPIGSMEIRVDLGFADDTRISAREAARRRMPLDGASAQALEGALAMTERERDEATVQMRGAGTRADNAERRERAAVARAEQAERARDAAVAEIATAYAMRAAEYSAAHPAASDYERVTRELADAAGEVMARLPSLAERKAKIDALRTARDGVHRPSAAPPLTCVCTEIDERDRPCLVCECNAPDLPEPCPVDDCVGGVLVRDNGMKSKCLDCKGTGRAGGGGHE